MRRAPGKFFREGITAVQLIKTFPDDDTAEAWFEEARWGGKPKTCPMCGAEGKIRENSNRKKPLPYHCGGCRRHFSVKTNSVMHRSKICFQNWAIAYYLWAISVKGVSSLRLHRELGITQKSAYFMGKRIRTACESYSGSMFGPVEVDEAFFGGKRKNMPKDKREELTGRGPVGKATVIAVTDRETGKIVARVTDSRTARVLQQFVRDNVEKGAVVYTDEAPAHKGLTEYKHETVNHSVSKYVREQAHVNTIESFWSLLKRGYFGTYHKMSPKHLHRYVDEFATWATLRKLHTIDMMKWVVARSIGKRLTYKQLIAKPQVA